MTIRKAVIPAAGLGTRFLPATIAQPKEMLPIVDKPTIQFVVEEAVSVGVTDILIVTGRSKRAIEDHFDPSVELEDALSKKGEVDLLSEIDRLTSLARIHYIRQRVPRGLGDAILHAESFVDNEPFLVLYGDSIVVQEGSPCCAELISVYHQTGKSVTSLERVSDEEVSRYGIATLSAKPVDLNSIIDRPAWWVRRFVEKPPLEEAPSRYANAARQLLTVDIFPILKNLQPGVGGEIQLVDALNVLAERGELIGVPLAGRRYDIGNRLDYAKTFVEFALKCPDIGSDLRQHLESLLSDRLAWRGRW